MTMKRLMILMALATALGCGDDSGGDDSGDGDDKTDEGDDGSKDAGQADASKSDASKPDAGSSGGQCDELSYAKFGKDFMDTYCASCHAQDSTNRMGAMEEDVFDTLAQIKARKDELQEQVKTEMMPFPLKGVKLPTDDERAQFDAWIECGPN